MKKITTSLYVFFLFLAVLTTSSLAEKANKPTNLHAIECLMRNGDVEVHIFEYDVEPKNVCMEISGSKI